MCNGTADRLSFVKHGDVKVMTFGRCLELCVASPPENGELVISVAVRQEAVSKTFSFFSRARFEAICVHVSPTSVVTEREREKGKVGSLS